MTALSIVTDVCNETGLVPPASLTTAGDTWGAQLLALANKALKEACKAKDWPVLEVDYTFPTVNGTAQYALPADFRSLVADTLYNQAEYVRLKGALSTAQFQLDKNLLLGAISRQEFRIYGSPKKINITPTPTLAENLVMVYRTSQFATSGGGVAKTVFTADTDLARIDEDVVALGLKWRLKHAKGLDYAEDRNDYDVALARDFAYDLAMGTISLDTRGAADSTPLTDGYVRELGFG